MRLRYTPQALSDIVSIAEYILECNPDAALRVRHAIQHGVDLVVRYPHLGALNAYRPGTRSRAVARYPYRIHYAVANETIIILHIRHTSRNP